MRMLNRVDTYHVVVIAPCEVGRGAILKIGVSKRQQTMERRSRLTVVASWKP